MGWRDESTCAGFQIRIDKLVDKWSGSIEIGVTTHNPNNLDYPATMTNLRSGNAHKHTHTFSFTHTPTPHKLLIKTRAQDSIAMSFVTECIR